MKAVVLGCVLLAASLSGAVEVFDEAWDLSPDDGKLMVTPEGKGLCRVDWRSRPGVKPSPKLKAVEVETEPALPGQVFIHLKNVRERLKDNVIRKVAATSSVVRVEVNLPSSETNIYQIVGVEFRSKALTNSTPFRIVSVKAVSDEPEGAALRLDVDTGDPIHVTDCSNPRADAVLVNHAKKRIQAKGRLEYRAFFGMSVDVPVDVTLEPGYEARFSVPELKEKGHWTITAVLTGEDGIEARQETAFANLAPRKVTPKIPLGEFRYGINVHSPRFTPENRKNVLRALVKMGAKLIRTGGTSLYEVCPQEGVYDFSKADTLVDEFERCGIAMQMNLYTIAHKWAQKPGRSEGVPPQYAYAIPPKPELFEDFVAKVTGRYGKRIDYYEMGNEWDLLPVKVMTSDEAIENIKAGYRGKMRGCPEALLTTPGFACPCDTLLVSQKGFLDRVLSGAKGHFDVQCSHNHGYMTNFEKYEGGELKKTRKRHGLEGVPWFPNETGLSRFFGHGKAWVPVPEHVFIKIITAQAFGACDYCWYVLRATGWDPLDGEQWYGVMTADFYPREGYSVFAALTEVYTELKYTATEFSQHRRRIYRFTGKDGTIAFAAWDNAGGKATVKVVTDAKVAEQIDLMGNAKQVPIKDGVAEFTLGFSPVTWRLRGGTMAQPDEKDMLAGAKEEQQTLVIPPGSEFDEKHPQSVMEYNFQVVNFYHGNPLTNHRIWTGKEDLSARLCLRRDEENILLRVVAMDDQHMQGEVAKDLWMHDGIQLAFNVPGEKDVWKIGLAMSGEGKALKTVWNAPAGKDKAAMESKMSLEVKSDGDTIVYEAKFPLKELGYDYTRLRNGVKFNLIVNDDDGEGRDGWIQMRPGLGDDFSTEPWVLLQFK